VKNSPDRLLQFAAYTVIAVFVVGFFFAPLGLWTGPILTAWFIGTQKPWRGFLLLAGLSFFLNLLSHWCACIDSQLTANKVFYSRYLYPFGVSPCSAWRNISFLPSSSLSTFKFHFSLRFPPCFALRRFWDQR